MCQFKKKSGFYMPNASLLSKRKVYAIVKMQVKGMTRGTFYKLSGIMSASSDLHLSPTKQNCIGIDIDGLKEAKIPW